jgi:hypothetical protein
MAVNVKVRELVTQNKSAEVLSLSQTEGPEKYGAAAKILIPTSISTIRGRKSPLIKALLSILLPATGCLE